MWGRNRRRVPYLDDTAERDSWRAPRGKPADPGRLWLSVKWDWRWIPLAGVIWGALGAGVAFGLMENTYRSSAALVWEPKSELRPDEKELAAEIHASIKAPAATGRARELLGLPIALPALGKLVDYHFEPHSRYVMLSAEGASPDDAMKLAKVIVRVFSEQQRAFAQQRALGAVAQRERELGEVQQRVDDARAAYEAFRTGNKLSDEEIQQAATPASGGAGGTADGGVADGAARTPEAAKLESLRAELKRLQATSKDHPGIPTLTAQIATMEVRVAQQVPSTAVAPAPDGQGEAAAAGEGGDEGQGAEGNDGKAPAKHSKLWKYLASQKNAAAARGTGRVSELTLGEQRRRAEAITKALELRKQIEVQQGQQATVEIALARTRAQSSVAHEDWRVLTAPSKPTRPERGMQGLIATTMPLTGMLVALLALLIRPLIDGRVYTAREAAYWARLPVLASTAWPRTREMFFPLVDELGQQATGAPGVTLVVGASAAEAKAAEELASWLDEGLISSRRRGAGGDKDAPFVSPAAGAIGSGEPREDRKPMPGGAYPNGVHAWQGDVDGPQLRRAARVVDRVIVLVTSGSMSFSEIGELRTRLGRSSGTALVMLGLNPTLLKLPDQSGEVGRFWRYVRRASARA